MSLRHLVEPDCGGLNPLMQFGNHLIKDIAFKDEGLSQIQNIDTESRTGFEENKLINEFLGHAAPPPQTFQMDSLLQEMRMIESRDFQLSFVNAPRVIDEVTRNSEWTKEFLSGTNEENKMTSINTIQPQTEIQTNEIFPLSVESRNEIYHVHPVQEKVIWAREFFDDQHDHNLTSNNDNVIYPDLYIPPPFSGLRPLQYSELFQTFTDQNHEKEVPEEKHIESSSDWTFEFSADAEKEAQKTAEYNQRFWDNLQDEWQKLSDENNLGMLWISEFTNYYDPYKEYTFSEENPMLNDKEALEKGKIYLAHGDIPNAVLCFEAAAKQNPENAESWELLGISQAENEMDPQAIAAMKKSLELNPGNMKVLMALAVSYTNESLQSQALKVLIQWLQCNPKYANLVKEKFPNDSDQDKILTNSLIRSPELKNTQNLFLEAVQQNPHEVDPDIQEALGVLFTLSSQYDKAVDCFKTALQVRPDNAKIWNRLGASLANGNRSIEAVEAYKRALEIAPGFIRARYNVGIVCMNLKAYKESAEHLLAALNLQATSSKRSGLKYETLESNQMSDTIWSTLRMVISLMGKFDLQDAINTKDLDTLNKTFEDMVQE